MAAGVWKYFWHRSHFTGGCLLQKCSCSSFCELKFSVHLTQGNFLFLTYFLFSLYSTVFNTFFFGSAVVSAACGLSIFMAVPSTLGSNKVVGIFKSIVIVQMQIFIPFLQDNISRDKIMWSVPSIFMDSNIYTLSAIFLCFPFASHLSKRTWKTITERFQF